MRSGNIVGPRQLNLRKRWKCFVQSILRRRPTSGDQVTDSPRGLTRRRVRDRMYVYKGIESEHMYMHTMFGWVVWCGVVWM